MKRSLIGDGIDYANISSVTENLTGVPALILLQIIMRDHPHLEIGGRQSLFATMCQSTKKEKSTVRLVH
jgi:hypothetical protein